MPGIVEFPSVVQEAVARFGGVFANEPERQHFADELDPISRLIADFDTTGKLIHPPAKSSTVVLQD